jgi:N6-L-threonylcarbamoyladenine synthase
MYVLAFETSADDTAAAVVEISTRRIVGQAIYTQAAEHAAYGGIVPEIASRAHQAHLPRVAEAALQQAGLTPHQVQAIAATTGPGLTTALAIGAAFGKTLALTCGKPFLGANHIEGHALSPLLAQDKAGAALAKAFLQDREPYLLLLATGGHTQLVLVEGVNRYHTLGTTQDDAVGECFDKTGALLHLAHPAGPKIESLAAVGDPAALRLPHPRTANPLDFSFSGLKTALRQAAEAGTHSQADIAASLQHTAAHILAEKLGTALAQTHTRHAVLAGGVAANRSIRATVQAAAHAHGATFTAPPPSLCTDNAAMIAYAAGLRHTYGLACGEGLGTSLLPRWPLESA